MSQAAGDGVEFSAEAFHFGQEFVDAAGKHLAAVCCAPTVQVCNQDDALADPLAFASKASNVDLEATLKAASLLVNVAIMTARPRDAEQRNQRQ